MFQLTEFRLFLLPVAFNLIQDGNKILSWPVNFVIVLVVTLELLYPLIDCIQLLIRVLKQSREEKEVYLPRYWHHFIAKFGFSRLKGMWKNERALRENQARKILFQFLRSCSSFHCSLVQCVK